jgi:hypothetical protein
MDKYARSATANQPYTDVIGQGANTTFLGNEIDGYIVWIARSDALRPRAQSAG